MSPGRCAEGRGLGLDATKVGEDTTPFFDLGARSLPAVEVARFHIFRTPPEPKLRRGLQIMKKLSYLLMTPLAGALFVGAVGSTGGCSSSSSGGSGGSTGTGGSGGAGANPLGVSATGFVSDSVTGVVGPWDSYADSIGSNASLANGDDIANSDCVKKGGFAQSACTMVTSPLGGQPFVPTDMDSSKMCTTGTGAKVINGTNGMPDYSDLWGGGIALDLNNPGGDAGAKGDFDLSAY